MGNTLEGERYSVQKPLIGYVREPSAEYTASDGKKAFLDLGWEYIGPDEALRLRGGKTGFVFSYPWLKSRGPIETPSERRDYAGPWNLARVQKTMPTEKPKCLRTVKS